MSATDVAVRTVDGVELPAPGVYEVDPSHSHVGFSVRHLMVSKVRGRFTSFHATIVIGDDPESSSVEATVDVASIDTNDAQRDAHLRSADFFDVEHFPTMTYRSTAVSRADRERWAVDGELTLRGVTRPMRLLVVFEGATNDPWGNVRAAFSATGELDREDFGLSWNQALDSGGFVLGKKVNIEIEVEAIRQG